MLSLILFASLACLLGIGLATSHFRAHNLTTGTWEQLIARIQPVELEGIRAVAMDHLYFETGRPQRGPEEMWSLLGGLKGLQRMNENARVMIALAAYAELQNNHQGLILADRMRRDGLALQRAVRSITLAGWFQAGVAHSTLHLQQAADSYQQMKQRLPALYEMSHAQALPAW